MRAFVRLLFASFVLIVIGIVAGPRAFAAGTTSLTGASASSITAAAGQPKAVAITTIPPGTVITIANWRQYQQFMPDGMITLFEGRSSWKMPDDLVMPVGPTVIHPLPGGYSHATKT